jgi:Leucine-rich repeat (LRR) protein
LPDGENLSLIREMKNLSLIDLSSNDFEIFPKELSEFPSLKVIRLIRNIIKEIPLDFLEKLNI